MKRDMDLVRTLLLTIEGGTVEFGDGTGEARIPFTEDEVMEHLRLMEQAGLVEVMSRPLSGPITLRGLTWEGHDFADSVRDPEVWRDTKTGMSKVGGWTVDLLKDAAKAYLKMKAKDVLGLDL